MSCVDCVASRVPRPAAIFDANAHPNWRPAWDAYLRDLPASEAKFSQFLEWLAAPAPQSRRCARTACSEDLVAKLKSAMARAPYRVREFQTICDRVNMSVGELNEIMDGYENGGKELIEFENEIYDEGQFDLATRRRCAKSQERRHGYIFVMRAARGRLLPAGP